MNAVIAPPTPACDRDLASALTIEAARACLAAFAPLRAGLVETVALHEIPGRVLARDIPARHASPPFDRAAMDGFAIHAGPGLARRSRLSLDGRLQAGGVPRPLGPGSAMRIFTGAPIPPGADAVVAREDADYASKGEAIVLARDVRAGDHVRRRGEDVAAGSRLLPAGTALDARHVALLASDGHSEVPVRARLRVAILSTGDELADAGEVTLGESAIHDANRPMLIAVARAAGFETVDAGIVADDPDALAARLAALAETCDAIVLSGGAARGEADHTARAIEEAGGACRRITLAVKPGKPLVAGRIGGALVVGLPGNPLAAFVSFAFVARPVLARMSGRADAHRGAIAATLAAPIARRPGRTEFVPARIVEDGERPRIAPLSGNSARLLPLCTADGLLEIAASSSTLEIGATVRFHPLGGLSGW